MGAERARKAKKKPRSGKAFVDVSALGPISIISHEFRTPLSVLQHLSGLILEKRLDESQRDELLRTIRDEAARLAGIVGQVMELTRIQTGQRPLDKSEVDLREEVEQSLTAMKEGTEARNVTFIESPGARVSGDRTLLAVLIRHALQNAVQFSPDRSTVRVELSVGKTAAYFRVVSEGERLPPSVAEQVFGMFVRAVLPQHREMAGAGLGLSYVDVIARAHGGSASMRAVDGGNRLEVRLPRIGSTSVRT